MFLESGRSFRGRRLLDKLNRHSYRTGYIKSLYATVYLSEAALPLDDERSGLAVSAGYCTR